MTSTPDMSPFNKPNPDEINNLVELIKGGDVTPDVLSDKHRERIAELLGGFVTHINDLEFKLEQARADLNKDPMTGLLNAQGFENGFADWLKETDGQEDRRIAIIYVDIDGLKRINDTHSHHAGDAAIKRLASVLARVTREGDIVAHLHGDEFVLGLPETRLSEPDTKESKPEHPSVDDYMTFLPQRIKEELQTESLLDRAKTHSPLDDQLIQLLGEMNFSYGGEVFNDSDLQQPLDHLLNIADQKMYAQKRARPQQNGRLSRLFRRKAA